MTQTNDCIICKLVSREVEVSMLYQDDCCSAFMDIQPINPGHLLVVPNRHAAYLANLKEEEGAQIFRVAHRLANVLRSGVVRCEGVNLFLADGEAAGQEVFHVHLHVFSRFAGDGFRLVHPPTYSQRPERKELETIAAAIRGALGGE